MGITKTNVRDFIEKVKYKATRSIEAKYDEKLQQRKEEIINSIPRLKYNLDLFEKIQAEMVEDLVGKAFKNKLENISYSFAESIKKDFRKAILNQDFMKDDEYQRLHKERTNKLVECRSSYKLISDEVESISSIKKKMEYLKELGFDISWLEQFKNEQVVKVDKSKFNKDTLFPCGDNK